MSKMLTLCVLLVATVLGMTGTASAGAEPSFELAMPDHPPVQRDVASLATLPPAEVTKASHDETPARWSGVAPVRVFAAASLTESLDEIGRAWTRESGQDVVVSYAASSALARQIEQGAPADVYISADQEWMDYLEQRGLIEPSTRANLAGNRLVLVAPAAAKPPSPTPSTVPGWLATLGERDRLAVAETTSVPAGRYARVALELNGGWPLVESRLVQGENVRAALAYVARGEVPLGVVYATDAQAEPKVMVVAVFSADDHPAITYPFAMVKSAHPARAEGFMTFLRSEEALKILARYGFTER